jgi:hypothetical protein
MTDSMRRVPLVAITLLLASAVLVGLVYVKTRRPAAAAVLHVDRVAQAVSTTSSMRSFAFTYSGTVAAGGHSLTMSGDGSSDLDRGLVEMTMRFSGEPQQEQANAEVVLDTSAGFVEYFKAAFLGGHLPAGKSWLKIDLGAIGKKNGIELDRLQQGDFADPAKMFSFLRRSAEPTPVGHEQVGGVETTHYSATVDLRRLEALETDAATRETLQRAIDLSGVSSYPVEAWIDDAGRLRRMRVTVPQLVPGRTDSTLTLTEELSDFGAPVHVSVPPQSDVVDLADLDGSAKPA